MRKYIGDSRYYRYNFKEKGLRKTERIVDKYGNLGTSGEYGSIFIDEKDFIPK